MNLRPHTTLRIPLVAPCVTNRDRQYMRQRVDDGLLEDETEVRRFEEAFAEFVGCLHAVAVSSGTTALTLALHALKVRAGNEVRIPTYGCTAVQNAVEALSGDPIFYDIDYDVYSASASTPETAHVVVHMFGTDNVSDYWDAMVEDVTLSLGGVPALVAELGVCSTHSSKMISTGRGGVVFGNNGNVIDAVRELADYETHTSFGYSAGMSSTQAALGVSQLGQLYSFIDRRRELAHRYTERFAAVGIDCPDADCGSVFFRYLIGVNDPPDKVAQLVERGIEAGRGVYPPLHRLAGLPDDDFPGATACVNRLLSVPVHPSIGDKEAEFIAEQVVQVCAP